MKEKECDKCKKECPRKELGSKIRGRYLCNKCKRELRKNHREETIRSYGNNKSNIPVPKGTTRGTVKQKNKSNSYISLEEKRNYLRMLMARGLTFEEAKDRIKNITQQQRKVREKMKEKNKSEDDIKSKQQELLEELWRT